MLKKWFIAACCSVVVCLAVTLWIVPQIKSSRAAALPQQPVSSDETPSDAGSGGALQGTSTASEPKEAGYLIGEYEGSVAVFRLGEDVPFQVLETPLSMLPEEDRRLLREGIQVETEEALASILEDYS